MSNAQPGWYQDPQQQGLYRWWDGVSWTEHIHNPQLAPQYQQPQYQQPQYQQPQSQHVGGLQTPTQSMPGHTGFPDAGYASRRPDASSYAAQPVSFGEAIRRGFTVWTIKGRASRSEYWYFVLFTVLATSGLQVLASFIGSAAVAARMLLVIACTVISCKVGIRRYHDTGRAGGKFVAIYATSLVSSFISLASFAAASASLNEARKVQGPDLDDEALAAAGLLALPGIIALLVALVISTWMIVILAKRGMTERNQFDEPNSLQRSN